MTCVPGSANFEGIFDYDLKKDRLEEVNRLLEDPEVWNDAQNAQALGREKKSLDDVVLVIDEVASGLADATELFGIARDESDDDTLLAVDQDAGAIETVVETLEFRRMFSN